MPYTENREIRILKINFSPYQPGMGCLVPAATYYCLVGDLMDSVLPSIKWT